MRRQRPQPDRVIRENYLRIERKIRTHSNGAIARSCKIHTVYVSRIFRGMQTPSIRIGLRIAAFVGITLEELIFFQDCVTRKNGADMAEESTSAPRGTLATGF